MSEKIFLYTDKEHAFSKSNVFISGVYESLKEFLKKNKDDGFEPICSVDSEQVLKSSKKYRKLQKKLELTEKKVDLYEIKDEVVSAYNYELQIQIHEINKQLEALDE